MVFFVVVVLINFFGYVYYFFMYVWLKVYGNNLIIKCCFCWVKEGIYIFGGKLIFLFIIMVFFVVDIMVFMNNKIF